MSDPAELPAHFDAPSLLALRNNPPRLGAWAMHVRTAMFGRHTLLRPTPAHALPSGPALLRREQLVPLHAWPSPEAWQAGDRLMLPVEAGDETGDQRYVEWLLEFAAHLEHTTVPENPHLGPCSLAPFSSQPAGTHRLWAIGVARLALPASIRVEARHDLIGIRLAQVALGFGADTLAGPTSSDRHLPVAGVTRPDEASIAGLRNLIEQAGLECALREDTAPRVLEAQQHTVRIKLSDLGITPKKD